MRKAAFVYIILAFALASCIKPPSYPAIPQIAFVSASPAVGISGYSDTITFSFTDGDGDIGVPSTNPLDTVTVCDSTCALWHGDSSCLHLQNFNVFVIDGRDNCVEPFASATVQTSGKYKGISGTVQVILAMTNTKCFGGCSSTCTTPDTVTYAIILRDIAGNFSNTIHTAPIPIVCPQ